MANNSTESHIIAIFAALMTASLTLIVLALGEAMPSKKSLIYALFGLIFALLASSTLFIKRKEGIGTLILILFWLAVILAAILIIVT